jgi:Zn/Cd-binding protein ZinT
LNSDLNTEKKKIQEQKNSYEEKLSSLNEKLNERDQDIKYLKNENLKSQNYYDDNLKGLQEQEGKKLMKFEESIEQLTENLKNLEDENKVDFGEIWEN